MRFFLVAGLLASACALAQGSPMPSEEPGASASVPQQEATPPPSAGAVPADAPVEQTAPSLAVPPPDPLEANVGQPPSSQAMVDGKIRQGAFLSGPGSLAFVVHHTLMAAGAGLVTQGFANNWDFGQGGREGMLVGALLGAGLGFGASAFWQFNHWVDTPAAYSAMANSVAGGLLALGLANLLSRDASALAWSAFLGMELGAWLTTAVGGGQLPENHALMMGSGSVFGAAYAGLLLAIVGNSGTAIRPETAFDVVAIAAGAGAGLMALATLKFNPTPSQVLRADLFGAGAGAVVLLLSGALLGFNQPTPYVLSLLSVTGAIAAASLLWDERAERGPVSAGLGGSTKGRYRSVW